MKERNFICKEAGYENYRILDEMSFPYGKMFKKNGVLVIQIDFPMDYDELQCLLNTVRQMDIGQFTKYAVEMKY